MKFRIFKYLENLNFDLEGCIFKKHKLQRGTLTLKTSHCINYDFMISCKILKFYLAISVAWQGEGDYDNRGTGTWEGRFERNVNL